MTAHLRIAVALLVSSLLVLLSNDPGAAQEDLSTLTVLDVQAADHPEVSLTLELPDGQAPESLEVSLRENGLGRSATVQAADRSAIEVVLVIDTSGSMAGAPLEAAKAAATAYVRQLPELTRVAVVGFGDRPYVVGPMTDNGHALEASILNLRAAGDTALYDALSLAVDQFSSADVPRSIILVSDGGDTASVAPLDEVTDRLVEGRVRLLGVRLVTDETNDAVLTSLAKATNGRRVDATDAATLAATYEAIARSAIRQVRIIYRSEAYGTSEVAVTLRSPTFVGSTSLSIELPQPPRTEEVSRPAPVPDSTNETAADDSAELLIGAATLFGGLALLLYRALTRPRRSLLAGARRTERTSTLGDLKRVMSERMERSLERRGRRAALGERLEYAGIALRPGEYLVSVGVTAGVLSALGLLLGGVGLAFLVAAVTPMVAWLLLSTKTSKRRALVEEQLPEVISQLVSSLRAGYGVMQALSAVADEMPSPMSDELHRVVTEVQIGRDLSESLNAMADRVGGQDFQWVVQAIEINREVGGDLVEVLEAVGATIRARSHLRRQIKTLSAQGRLSARLLIGLPFVLALVISVINPGYLSPLIERSAGPVLLAIGGVLMSVGWLWLRRIVRLEY